MNEQGKIRFVINQQETEIDFHRDPALSPTTTLLQYLRQKPGLSGTKEGCAEGDCGACTVALLSLDSAGKLECRAIDSCLVFLPMLHQKVVITVEGIGSLEQPHAAQKAMVDFDGSQCGYCTPGFVMSLYALGQNHHHASDEVILDALTGNLCRCTGYRSIMEAARNLNHMQGAIPQNLQEAYLTQLSSWEPSSVSIVSDEQKYFQPASLEQALELMSMYPQALLINGATDVALKVTKNDELLEEIIDLSALKELTTYQEQTEEITYGAGLTLEQVKSLSQPQFPALYDALKVFGSLQIRNLATLGGNIGSASPIGDTLPILMAYQARVNLVSSARSRTMELSEFITGYRNTALQSNELILSITLPKVGNTAVKWYKISKRKDLDISTVSGGFRLELDQQGHVSDIGLYYGGVAAMTKPALKAQSFLIGKPWTEDYIQQAQQLVDEDFMPISDARSSAASRKIMARNLLLKFWIDTKANDS